MNMVVNNDKPEIEFYIAYYGEPDNVKTKSVLIPIKLKEKFLETFKDNSKLNKEEIFKFLEDNE
jgi:hypothetical protein